MLLAVLAKLSVANSMLRVAHSAEAILIVHEAPLRLAMLALGVGRESKPTFCPCVPCGGTLGKAESNTLHY